MDALKAEPHSPEADTGCSPQRFYWGCQWPGRLGGLKTSPSSCVGQRKNKRPMRTTSNRLVASALFCPDLLPPSDAVTQPTAYLQPRAGKDAARLWPSLASGISKELVQSRGPAAQGSVCSGNPRNVAASARCAATAMRPLHRSTHAACAAGRSAAGVAEARARARRRRKEAASASQRPPTSSPNTTKRHRLPWSSSG